MRVPLLEGRPIPAMMDTEVCRPIDGEDDSLRWRWSAFAGVGFFLMPNPMVSYHNRCLLSFLVGYA